MQETIIYKDGEQVENTICGSFEAFRPQRRHCATEKPSSPCFVICLECRSLLLFHSFPSVPWLLYYCTVFIHLSGHQGLRPKANILMGVLDTQQIHALFCYMSWVPFLVAFHSFPWSLVVFFVFFPTWVSSMNFRRSHFSINDLMPTHCTGPSQRKDNSTARRMYESKTHVRTIIKIRAS